MLKSKSYEVNKALETLDAQEVINIKRKVNTYFLTYKLKNTNFKLINEYFCYYKTR
jgi:hypothetical protein